MKKKRKLINHKEFSRRGGLARAKNLPPEERKSIASKGGKTAAANKKKAKERKNGK